MRPLSLRTRILVRELASGEVLAVPVCEPERASFGAEDDALLEQQMFLSEHLAVATPETVARFALPEGTRLHTSRVLVPREDLPHAVEITQAIEIPCVVIPSTARAKSDVWVVVVPLDYTFFVPAGEDLDAAVQSEVLRLVAAQEAGALFYLGLLPGARDELAELEVKIERGESGPAGRAATHRKALAQREKKKHAALVLESVGTLLVADDGRRPVLGRDADKQLLASILGGEERQSVVLVGEPKVGKTALVQAWLADEADAGRARLVYATSGAQLIAGMSGLGQWQERVRRVMEAAHTLDAVLYFDDLADLFSERAHGIDLAGAMKPWLEEGKVRLVGELAKDRAEQVESRHVGFFACTSRIRVAPMTHVQALVALRARAVHDGKHEPHKVQVADAALVAICDLAERYLPYEAFPGKAARLYDDLRASREVGRSHREGEKGPLLEAADVFEWFSVRTGVPTFLLRDDSALRAETILAHFDRRLIGQEEAKARVQGTISVVKAGLQPAGKPLATFLFVGPTGVGKTELARATAELLFGSADRLVRFDMSEYTDPWAAERLIRGTERGDGLLTRKVREQPFSVVLLDEIEKAHPAVFDLLLQVCGEGRLTDGRGKTAYFHNTLLIMTSNLGAAHRRGAVGFEGDRAGASDEAYYTKEVDKTFRPEMVNRIDRVVAFRHLTRDEIRSVTRLAVERVKTRRGLSHATIELAVSDAALDLLAENGFSDAYGARALRRHVEDHLATPIARMLTGSTHGGARDVLDVRTDAEPAWAGDENLLARTLAGGLVFSLLGRPRGPTLPMTSAWSLSELRRQLQRFMRLDRVVEIKSQLEFVVAQLSYGDGADRSKKKKKGTELARAGGAELGRLSAEHHRLNEVWSALDGAFKDLQSAEELGFAAFFAGERFDALLDEARAIDVRFRAALLQALLCRDPKRFGITLLLSELDAGRALDVWLAPLLSACEARGWELELHVDANGKEERARQPSWPEARRWGPARTAREFKDVLADRERTFKNVLLRARGPNVGVLLGLEGGLHRFHDVHPEVRPCHLLATRIAFRATLQDKDWVSPTLAPPQPGAADHARRLQPTREILANEGIVHVFAKRSALKIPLADYWKRFDEIALAHLLLFETRDDLDRDVHLDAVFEDEWDDVTELVRQGRLIEAIKRYRERTGLGLKEAKDYVDALRGS
jgi:ATP-dependent Clp protease ATP-binding subunit ClpC